MIFYYIPKQAKYIIYSTRLYLRNRFKLFLFLNFFFLFFLLIFFLFHVASKHPFNLCRCLPFSFFHIPPYEKGAKDSETTTDNENISDILFANGFLELREDQADE